MTPTSEVSAGSLPSPQGAPAARAGYYLAIALSAHLLLVLLLRHFPYQDTVNHVARYVLIDRAWSGLGVSWIRVDWVPTPYLAVDLLGAGLVHLVGPHATVQLIAALSLAALPVGMYLLLGAVAPAQRIWALVGVLLSASPFFLKGLLNYQLGIGALFVWISLWWPRRNGASLLATIGLALGLMLLLLIHLASGGVALLLLGLDTLFSLRPLIPLGNLRTLLNRRNLRTDVICGLASLILLWLMRDSSPAGGAGHPTIKFHGILGKLGSLTEPFFTFTPWEMVLTLGGYVIMLAAFIRMHRGRWTMNVMAALAGALLLLYLISPDEVNATSHLDARWLIPLYLLAFTLVPDSKVVPRRWVGPVLLSACLLHVAMVYAIGRGIDRELDDFETVLGNLPSSARLLPLVGGEPRYGRVEPFLHFALWHTAMTSGRVGFLFSSSMEMRHLRHFHELDPPWSLGRAWRVMGRPELPWDRIRAGYDYIVVAGDDPDLAAVVRAGACEVDRRGQITVYAVGH